MRPVPVFIPETHNPDELQNLPRTQTSLFKTCAQRKAGRRQSSVPFPWSLAVHRQSLVRARLCHAKNEAPEEAATKCLPKFVQTDVSLAWKRPLRKRKKCNGVKVLPWIRRSRKSVFFCNSNMYPASRYSFISYFVWSIFARLFKYRRVGVVIEKPSRDTFAY